MLFNSCKTIAGTNGLITYPCKNQFRCLVIGEHISEAESFNEVYFTFNNMQEFFFPKGWQDAVSFSHDKKHVSSIDGGEFFVWNHGSFSLLRDDISAQIHCKDTNALQSLQNSINEIRAKNKDAHFMVKQDIQYKMALSYPEGKPINDIVSCIYRISDLFSLLSFQPITPENIELLKNISEDKQAISIKLFPTTYNSPNALEEYKSETSFHHLPLTADNVNLEKTIPNWLALEDSFEDFVESIQSQSSYNSTHSVKSDIVLSVVQLEKIAFDEGHNKGEKYLYPLKEYASIEVLEYLQKLLKVETLDKMGEYVADLRNDIAHISKRRKKKILDKLSLRDLVKISICFKLSIAGYILKEIGFSKDLIRDYQIRLIPNR